MHVQVDLDQAIVYLADAEDTHRLLVVVSGSESSDAVARALGDAGSIDLDDPDHAWVSIGWLRTKGGAVAGGAWGDRFDALLRHADEDGNLSDDRTLVRAPVEWTLNEEEGEEID